MIARAVLVATLAALGLGACGGDEGGSAESFCADLQEQAPLLMNPQVATDADVEVQVDLYEELGRSAPLAIEEEWDALTDSVQTAAGVDPTDPESMDAAVREAYASVEAAQHVRDWVIANCGFDLAGVGPVVDVVPGSAPSPSSTTTASSTPTPTG